MNNKERRNNKRIEFYNSLPKYDQVFSFMNLYNAELKCEEGVKWKQYVQRFQASRCERIYKIYKALQDGTYETIKFKEFFIMERGKLRHIKAPAFSDRVVQRCLCDNYLVPLLSHYIIYDNSATIKDRGTEFAIKRLRTFLEKFSHKYWNCGYILIYDFKDYFNSINHQILYNQIDPMIIDERLKAIIHKFIDDFGEVGLGLGSQVSQICAVFYPNKIDHYFKDILKVKYYERYMDDGCIISESLEDIQFYKKELFRMCEELDLDIDDSKIKIIKLSHGFTFLKHKFIITDENHIVVRNNNKTFTKMRRKLHKFLDNPKMSFKDVFASYASWRGSVKKYKNYYAIKRMDKIYNDLYITPFANGDYKK